MIMKSSQKENKEGNREGEWWRINLSQEVENRDRLKSKVMIMAMKMMSTDLKKNMGMNLRMNMVMRKNMAQKMNMGMKTNMAMNMGQKMMNQTNPDEDKGHNNRWQPKDLPKEEGRLSKKNTILMVMKNILKFNRILMGKDINNKYQREEEK
jgi:hypothetical protein